MNKSVEVVTSPTPAADDDTPPGVTPEEEAQAQDDFDSGLAMEAGAKGALPPEQDKDKPRGDDGRFVAPKEEKPAAKVDNKKDDKVAAKPADKKDDKPAVVAKPAATEYVRLTKEQYDKITNVASKADDFEKQFSKAFGTIGDMQKILRNLQTQTPRGAAVKLPPGAFDAMKKDFPELAAHMQTAMEGILKDVEGTGTASAHTDPEEFKKQLDARVLALAAEDLADEFPDWKKIVGAVDLSKGEKTDPNNPFRKWLGTKPQEYQDRINNATSAGVITRAIRIFKSEIKTASVPAKPNKQIQARNDRLRGSVRPKGDGGHPPASNAEDDFDAGFKSG